MDYEIEQLGQTEQSTAHDGAQWRYSPVPKEVTLALSQLKPAREANCIADALGYLLFAEHHNEKKTKASEQAAEQARKAKRIKQGWPEEWKGF